MKSEMKLQPRTGRMEVCVSVYEAHVGLHYYYFTQQEAGQMEKGIFW